ncbi:ThiF family adenylyltransferase [Psychrobacter sp. I-STPA6b]|uniref:tRNA threonylcarbamoyladenosine dehydratase n=1 Tax=Psychrobacter sp. I-STPA6b TaxID=2585718 RepID=UPI001D0C62C8|nr:tRNA threonylcarbamoyladenosine dehydratase [Psychrobacter sp. I-STPA6b]
MTDSQYHRRFAGTQKLYGQSSFQNFERAHVYVIGVGGVGTWVAEGLARTGVGELTLVDLDVLVASNVNRQLPALDSTFGCSKIEVMAERIKQINPQVQIHLVDDFLTAENVATLLPSREQMTQARQEQRSIIILDCTDDMSAKMAIALHCRFNKLKLICAGGAGGKTDPLQVTVSDLKDSYQDPLLARLRSKLRHEKNINTQMKEKFGIRCVYSTQPPITEQVSHKNSQTSSNPQDAHCQLGGLHCGGYGSAVAVTATVGMVMVSEALMMIASL